MDSLPGLGVCEISMFVGASVLGCPQSTSGHSSESLLGPQGVKEIVPIKAAKSRHTCQQAFIIYLCENEEYWSLPVIKRLIDWLCENEA